MYVFFSHVIVFRTSKCWTCILSVANIRGHLAAAVPQHDQILLLGPPYKVPKDSTLQSDEIQNALRLGDIEDDPTTLAQQKKRGEASHYLVDETTATSNTPRNILLTSTERSGARRLFLFSKQALSEQSPDPVPCHLEPMNVELPMEAPGPSPLNMPQPQSQQPLHQALAAYERQFMLYLAQGRVLADGADLRVAALRQCVQEQAVMCRALRAAVSNLSDHFSAAARTRAEFSVVFTSKSAAHANLLQKFDTILNSLSTIPLHPSLIGVARASGRTMETLLDTVPVERERAWAQQCNTSHQRLAALFRELDVTFNELGTTSARQEEARQDYLAEQDVETLWAQVDGTAAQICIEQGRRLEQLTSGHQNVVKVISNALNGNPNELQNAFSPLQELSSSSKDLVPDMIADDAKLKQLMERVSEAKTNAMRRMKVRLREVSLAQSSIQRVLASVGVLRDALTQQTENMVHLEHVAELAESYRQFLFEIQRRRAYGQAVSSSSVAMMERLAAMRIDEVKARERFLRGPGRHLMPSFFDTFVPTLATPPPLFTPQLPAMAELDTLPDVSDVVFALNTATPAAGSGRGVGGNNNIELRVESAALSEMQRSTAVPVHSSASTLTAESQGQQTLQHPEVILESSESQQRRQQEQQEEPDHLLHQDQLIVSADEASGADLILDPAGDAVTAAATNAEVKTLAYENAVLRQALERLGGKPPRTYMEERRLKDDKGDGAIVDEIELATLRKELMDAKAKAQAAKDALEVMKAKSGCYSDKISHSSFEIGDVGLFMPTGRGSGGKRTYLAFHTNCPHRYLSTDSVKGTPDFVLGRIVYQEELTAGEMGTDANPYGLHVGTPFFVLTVEILNNANSNTPA
jgi:autophagy-related protein 11